MIQNNCLRICLGIPNNCSTDELHEESKLPCLELEGSNMTVRLSIKASPAYQHHTSITFIVMSDKYNVHTRSNVIDLLDVPAYCLNVSRGNIKYRGPTYYDKLPIGLRSAPSYPTFKYKSKTVCCLQHCINIIIISSMVKHLVNDV